MPKGIVTVSILFDQDDLQAPNVLAGCASLLGTGGVMGTESDYF